MEIRRSGQFEERSSTPGMLALEADRRHEGDRLPFQGPQTGPWPPATHENDLQELPLPPFAGGTNDFDHCSHRAPNQELLPASKPPTPRSSLYSFAAQGERVLYSKCANGLAGRGV